MQVEIQILRGQSDGNNDDDVDDHDIVHCQIATLPGSPPQNPPEPRIPPGLTAALALSTHAPGPVREPGGTGRPKPPGHEGGGDVKVGEMCREDVGGGRDRSRKAAVG